MNELKDYYSKSCSSSLEGKKSEVVHVYAVSPLPKIKAKWKCIHKGKLWLSDDGFVIENASYKTSTGGPNRLFLCYRSYDSYDRGVYFDSSYAIARAKVVCQEFQVKRAK